MPVEPKIASTVILLRERVPDLDTEDDCEFEIFMAKRHENARFMSEHHVFPGGSIEEQDLTKESRARLVGIEEDVLDNLKEVCDDPSNLWVVAIRELFEEAGILIATNKTGKSLGKIEDKPKKIKKYQKKLQKKRTTMTNVLTKENLYYSASDLRYFGRLITPKLSPIRYDTQFFICKFPKNQNINLFSDELTESQWGSPKQLLDQFKNRQIKLIFPQYSTLQRLQKFRTLQEVFDKSKDVSCHNRLNEI
ncbi:MAG: NUDIX hydrolase [Promethearchaeota archaeon]|jgi:8-oxo-dGTP pyrophosphatase MutT (NUDIX family)